MINIIKYNGDKLVLVRLMEELQDYLVQIDPLKIIKRSPDYGENYVDNLLDKTKKHCGVIYIAELENLPIGMVAGILEKRIKDDEIDSVPTKSARILELIVNEKYRGNNIGSLLMNKIEDYFQHQGCDIVRLEVFVPNMTDRNFYHKHGYHDRVIDMVKSYRKS